MEKRKTTILIVEDDRTLQSDPFVIEISLEFENLVFKENTTDALAFIKENIKQKIVVLLDLAFSDKETQGVKFLEELRSFNRLIPVIIWSGRNNISDDEFKNLINDLAFGFLTKGASSEEIKKKLIQADDYLNSSIDSTIEIWLQQHSEDEKNKPFLATSNGISYSMNDLLSEIRNQTAFGKSIAMDINKLTLDLLFRNKEKI